MPNTFFIALLTAAGRSHGIGGGPALRWFSIIAFTLAFAYGAHALYGWYATPLAIVTAMGLNTGHGRFFAMRGANLNDPNPEWIETAIVQRFYRGDVTKPIYSWLCMGTKGLMIGLPVFPFGIALGLLWPAAYVVSFRYVQSSLLAEYLTGYFAGVILCLSILTF